MKLLPKERKRTILMLLVLAISSSGIIYLNFFAGPSRDNTAVPTFVVSLPGSPLLGGSPINTASSDLPLGEIIDISVLDSEKFKVLKGAPPLSVSLEELGKTNLFAR